MNPNFDAVGTQFVKLYYDTFDADRQQLLPLYRADSMLTFEGVQVQGVQPIVEKLKSLPFGKVTHVVTTVDCQPSCEGGVLVMVVGQLKADNDPPHGFSQTFFLKPNAPGNFNSYYVYNDIFRLALHHQ